MADKTTTLQLKLVDGLSAAAMRAAKAMHGVGVATDKLNNKRVRIGGFDQAEAAARRSSNNMLRMERELERAIDRRVAKLQRAAAAQERAAAAAARAAAEERRYNSFGARAGRFANGVAAVGTGAVAAGHMIAPKFQKAMTYDQLLSYGAITMASGGTVGDTKRAKADIAKAVDDAVKASGGSRDNAVQALSTLFASGKFEGRSALDVLPSVTKAAFATDADATDIANMAVAMRNADVPLGEMMAAFDDVAKAGQLGAFELKNMAKHFPSQLAMAKGLGMSGREAVKAVAVWNQVAMGTAGSADEAGNNLLNLLQKLSSRELQDTMAKVVTPQRGDPTQPGEGKGKKKKAATFDFTAYLAQQRLKGVDPVTALTSLLDREVGKNPTYAALTKKIATAKDEDEKTPLLKEAAKIAEGGALGRFLADRQALLGLLAMRYGRNDQAQIRAGVDKSGGTINSALEFLGGELWVKAQAVQARVDEANRQSYDAVSGPLGTLAQRVTEAADAFPKLTSAIYGVGSLMGAGAAGFGGAMIWSRLFGSSATGVAATGAGAAGMAGLAVPAVVAGTGSAAAFYVEKYLEGLFPEFAKLNQSWTPNKTGLFLNQKIREWAWPSTPEAQAKAAQSNANASRIQDVWGVEDGRADHRLGGAAPLPPTRPSGAGGATAPLPPVRPPDIEGGESAAAAAGRRTADAYSQALQSGIKAAMALAQGQIQTLAAGMAATIPIKVTPRIDGSQLRSNHADGGL